MIYLYYTNEDHKKNYAWLLQHFGCRGDREYEVACYVLSTPEIFLKVDWRQCSRPFEFLKWRGNKRVDLSSGYRHLVDLAKNLFNPINKFNLMDALSSWDKNCFQMFQQAVMIRMGV